MSSQIKILIISDKKDDIKKIEDQLKQSTEIRFIIEKSFELNEGINLLSKIIPDIILLDLTMTGYIDSDTIPILISHAKNVPVIVLTDEKQKSLGEEALKKGVQDHLLKGCIDTFLLVHSIHQAIEMKHILKKVNNNEEIIASLLNVYPDEVLVVTPEGKIVLINENRAKKIGRHSHDLIGVNIFNTMSPDSAAKFKGRIQDVKFKKSITSYEEQREGRYMNVTLYPVKEDNDIVSRIICLGRDITEIHRTEDAIKSLTLIDELTGIYNRRGFSIIGEQLIKIYIRKKRKMVLLFVDLDNMRWINDTHGNAQGDLALKKTTKVLCDTFRDSDLIARWGGDEFAVLAVETQDVNPDMLTTRLMVNLSVENEGLNFKLSLSIGFAMFDPMNPNTLEELIEKADQAMYKNKRWKPKL